jgi:hypothetical protein
MTEQKSRPDRVATVAIIAALVGLVIVVFLVINLVQKSQSPEDAQATGFGDEATSDLYAPVAEMFFNTDCETILDGKSSDYPADSELAKLNAEFTSTKLSPEDDTPLTCEYSLGEGKTLTFVVFSYDENSEIDATYFDLYSRVNNEVLSNTIDSGVLGIMDYYFGEDAGTDSSCRTVIYHPLNDFESAQLIYNGFNCNEIVASYFNVYLFAGVDYVYRNFGATTTEDLLYQWDLADRAPDLTYYLTENVTE